VIAALAKITTESAMVWESMQALEKLSHLAWIPRRYGIPRNEEPDKFAKEGTNGVPSDQTVGMPFDVGKEVIWSHLIKKHMNRWKTCEVCRPFKPLMSKPLPIRKKELQAMSRQKLKVAVGMLKGHMTLTAKYV